MLNNGLRIIDDVDIVANNLLLKKVKKTFFLYLYKYNQKLNKKVGISYKSDIPTEKITVYLSLLFGHKRSPQFAIDSVFASSIFLRTLYKSCSGLAVYFINK